MGIALRYAVEFERLRLVDERAHGEDRDPVRGPGERHLLLAGNEHRALDACHARLRGAVEVRVEDRNPKSAGAQRTGEVKRQGALADAAFAGSHRHQMADAGEPVGDADALFGNLLEDSGASVAGDVVVALHGERIAYTVRGTKA